MTYHIYTDGGARGNGQDKNCPCGVGVYSEDFNAKISESFVFKDGNTNQKAELMAGILGTQLAWDRFMEGHKNMEDIINVIIHSDSAYLVNGMNSWINNWQANGWINSKKEEVKNKHLWMALLNNKQKLEDDFNVNVVFEKVKGHSTNEGNIIADTLVNQAMDCFPVGAKREGEEFMQ